MVELAEIVLYESENEFASCLEDLFMEYGIRVQRIPSYDELVVLLRNGRVRRLICDLGDNTKKTESFLLAMISLQRPPEKVVFTSIYNDIERWPLLAGYKGENRFIPKPFRTQQITSFLMEERGHQQSAGA